MDTSSYKYVLFVSNNQPSRQVLDYIQQNDLSPDELFIQSVTDPSQLPSMISNIITTFPSMIIKGHVKIVNNADDIIDWLSSANQEIQGLESFQSSTDGFEMRGGHVPNKGMLNMEPGMPLASESKQDELSAQMNRLLNERSLSDPNNKGSTPPMPDCLKSINTRKSGNSDLATRMAKMKEDY